MTTSSVPPSRAPKGLDGAQHHAGFERVAQVFLNLVSNAIEFSPPGAEVQVRITPHGDLVRVEVSDHGRGISPDKIPKLFRRFGQAEADDARRQRGIGLGLFICKGFVERQGGQIGVDSTEGVGSTFWFTLPGPGSAHCSLDTTRQPEAEQPRRGA